MSQLSFINGVNYGNVFIPENFFADINFYQKNNIPMVGPEYSLCDLTGPDATQVMTDWLDSMIKASDFAEMQQLGVNFVRVPLGWWNVYDMPDCPNAPEADSLRMCNLKSILMSHWGYRPYIDRIMTYARNYGIKVLLDLHGAPGSQNGASHSGCSVNGFYWDTEWNKENSINAVRALSEICRANMDSCYGVEVLNEPGWGIDRASLQAYYQAAILAAREALPMWVPVVVFEWNPLWPQYWQGRWETLFPYKTYGRVELDTHIYHFENNVYDQENDWNNSELDLVQTITKEAPLMIGEWTMSASEDIPTPDLQPWAQFIQDFMVNTGTLGSAHWLWSDVERDWWSMRKLSYLGTPGGVDWAQVFGTSTSTFVN